MGLRSDGDNIADPGNCDEATDGSNLDLVAAGSACDVADGTFDICAVTNADEEEAPWPYENKDGGDTFLPGMFLEGGINLSDMFGDEPPCFGTFLAETRSSQETERIEGLRPRRPEHLPSSGHHDPGQRLGHRCWRVLTDTADLTGNSPIPTGSIEFWLCGPNATQNPDCSTGGTLISTEILVAGLATSDPFTADSVDDAGYYCFRAEYTPDEAAGNNYLEGSHTNLTTECFRVVAADVDVEKTADDASVNAGEQIGFDITVSSTDAGTALNVSMTDTLPTNAGLELDDRRRLPAWAMPAPACNIAAGVLTCTDGSMPNG